MKAYFSKYYFVAVLLLLGILYTGCNNSTPTISNSEKEIFNSKANDTVAIANDSLEYEIIIIDPGFNTWIQSIARPRGYYSKSYLQNRNMVYVNEWNRRVMMPLNYDPSLYEMKIDYLANIDYGYEVNYQLYNYFIYFQRKYNQRLAGFIPHI